MNTPQFSNLIDSSVAHIKLHYNENYNFYNDKNFKEPLATIGQSLSTMSEPLEIHASLTYLKNLLGKEVPGFLVPSTNFLLTEVLFQVATNLVEASNIENFHRDIIIENLSASNNKKIVSNIVSSRKKFIENDTSHNLSIK